MLFFCFICIVSYCGLIINICLCNVWTWMHNYTTNNYRIELHWMLWKEKCCTQNITSTFNRNEVTISIVDRADTDYNSVGFLFSFCGNFERYRNGKRWNFTTKIINCANKGGKDYRKWRSSLLNLIFIIILNQCACSLCEAIDIICYNANILLYIYAWITHIMPKLLTTPYITKKVLASTLV